MAIIQSIERAMQLLELLAEDKVNGFPLQVISHRSGLKAPTCRNILSTLIGLGYISQDLQSRRYWITSKAIFGREQAMENSLIQQSLPILQGLVHQFSETIILCRYRNARRKTLLALQSLQALRVAAQEGEDEQFFTTATGRMLVSMLPAAEVKRLLKSQPGWQKQWPEFDSAQPATSLFHEIHQAGYLLLNRDNSIQALAVPVLFPKTPIYATIGMYYPLSRHSQTELPSLIGELQSAAQQISSFSIS
ncbi:MAG: helix-turn-helix domain-containing protein [Lentisphaeria bacterium]